MSNHTPRVSIGLPVYNGERYVAQSIESILAQTFHDFELIISDNGSTDATETLCRAYAERDTRIRYYRNNENKGLAWNHNRTVELARAAYFKWAGHDDLWAPELLQRCVEALDSQPEVILAYTRMTLIDEHDQVIEQYRDVQHTYLPRPYQRFYELVRTTHRCPQIHGLMRIKTLKRTPLLGTYTSSDVTLLASLSLLGKFYEVPEYLFSYRLHIGQSIHLNRLQRTVLFEPSKSGRIIFPEWRLFYELLRSAYRAPVSWSERAQCTWIMLCWPLWLRHWRRMGKEVIIAAQQVVQWPALLRVKG